MTTVHFRIFAVLIVGLASADAGQAQQAAAPEAKPAAAGAAKTYTLRRQPFVVRVELDGVLESTEMHEVRLVPETWSSWTVDRAVAHGTKVRKGDSVLWFNRRALDQKLEDLAAGRELTELALKQAVEELAILEKSVPIELAKVRRAAKVAGEDMTRFAKIAKPAAVRNSEFSLESAENYLAYEKEELKQLERMYKADDLTDETEEIILRRARDSVKRAEHTLLRTKEKHKETLAVELPRLEVGHKEVVESARLALAAVQIDLPLKLSKARLEVEKLKYDHRKADVEWKRLKVDAEKLIVKAPTTGVVYYGRCENGSWSTASTIAKMLRPGGTVTPHAVLMTIVNPSTLVVRAEVPEKQLGAVHTRQSAVATVIGLDRSIVCTVKSLVPRPSPGGKYFCLLQPAKNRPREARIKKLTPDLHAGMKCRVDVIVQSDDKALVVPRDAAHSSDQWDDVHYVFVVGEGGKPEKRWVQLGRQQGELVEIKATASGIGRPGLSALARRVPWQSATDLKEGDRVLLEKPSDPGTDMGKRP